MVMVMVIVVGMVIGIDGHLIVTGKWQLPCYTIVVMVHVEMFI